MTRKHDAPIFFLSYAQDDADEDLARFFQDLCLEVRGRIGLSRNHPIGFRDTRHIETGDRWPEELSLALSTCGILLPLYSRSFFSPDGEYCGKEWSAFRHRMGPVGPIPKLILPVLWTPLGTRFEQLPKEIRDIQYSFADLGETYRLEGLRYLLRIDAQKDNYQQFLAAFAKKVVSAVEAQPLPAADPLLDIETFPNVFQIHNAILEINPAPAPRSTRVKQPEALRVAEELGFDSRYLKDRDDLLTRAERVCRLREPRAQVERISGEDDSPDHLRVTLSEGGIVREYPVAAVEDDISLEHLNAFCIEVDQRYRRADSGMRSYLVYGGEPANEALLNTARQRRVLLLSFLEYTGLIDFRNYLRRQTAELSQDRVYPPNLYVAQRMNSLYPKEDCEDAIARISEWLLSPNQRFIVVLGDFGTGKTFLLHELARRMSTSEVGPIPILLQMRSLEKGRSLAELLGQHFGKEEVEGYSFSKFRYMLEQGRIALLFDGFDELALRSTYERATDHFKTLIDAAQGDAKIIVTARRQHFLSEQQVLSKLGEQVELISGNRIGILQPFSRRQIQTFLLNRCGTKTEADAKLELIDTINDLIGLSENPRMLGFIADLPEEQLREAAAGGEITAAKLYRLILERWLIHEFERVHPNGAPPGLSVQDRWNAVTLLALRLWQKTESSANLDDIKKDTAEAIREIDRVFDEAIATFQIGSGTLLVRDDGGNFSFLHQSILEFLVAQAVAVELKSEGTSSLLSKKDLSLLMIDFLTSLAGKESVAAWAHKTTRDNDEIAKRNALLILDRLKVMLDQVIDLSNQDFSGQDLSDQNLTDANLNRANFSSAKLIRTRLRGARLSHANFRDADLTRAELGFTNLSYADLSRARLLGADLIGARLENTIFDRTKLIGAAISGTMESVDFFGSALQPPELVGGMILSSLPCRAVAWHPQRDLLASAEGSLLRLWDPFTGQLIRSFQGHLGFIYSVAFDPKGKTLASASNDRTLRLWDAYSGQEIRVLQGHQQGVTSVAFSREGDVLASSSNDYTVRLWDTRSGQEIRAFQGHKGGVNTVAFSPGGNILASASYDNTLRLWDTHSGQEIVTLHGHERGINSVAFSPNGHTFASAASDYTVRLWDTGSGREIQIFQGHQGIVFSVAFHPESDTLASASYDNTVRLWDIHSGRELQVFEGHKKAVHSVAFGSKGNTLASASDDNSVRLWDTASGRQTQALQGHQQGVFSVVFSPNGNSLASTYSDNTFRLWDTACGRQIRNFEGHEAGINSVAFSPDGRALASASYDNTVRLWDAASGRQIRNFQGHSRGVFSVVFSPDGKNLASASYDDTVRLWDTASGRQIRIIKGHHRGVNSVVFSPDGKNLASASSDYTVRFWDTASGRQIRNFHGHRGAVYSVVFSADGKNLASASYDNTVRLWDLASGRQIRNFEGHQGGVYSVAFSPDGKNLVSASDDNTVRLWNTASGLQIRDFQGHQRGIFSVVFNADGNTLASASDDSTVRLWDVATGRCIVTLVHLPEGWASFTPDGRYKYGGVIAGGFWHAINLCRFEVGELDDFVPGLRLADNESFFDLPTVPPWVQTKE